MRTHHQHLRQLKKLLQTRATLNPNCVVLAQFSMGCHSLARYRQLTGTVSTIQSRKIGLRKQQVLGEALLSFHSQTILAASRHLAKLQGFFHRVINFVLDHLRRKVFPTKRSHAAGTTTNRQPLNELQIRCVQMKDSPAPLQPGPSDQRWKLPAPNRLPRPHQAWLELSPTTRAGRPTTSGMLK